jgi:hypothetical protein
MRRNPFNFFEKLSRPKVGINMKKRGMKRPSRGEQK